VEKAALEKDAFQSFCHAHLDELTVFLHLCNADPDILLMLKQWSQAVEEAAQRAMVQNQNPEALLGWLLKEFSKQ
jgi:hypothetical protein